MCTGFIMGDLIGAERFAFPETFKGIVGEFGSPNRFELVFGATLPTKFCQVLSESTQEFAIGVVVIDISKQRFDKRLISN